ncbi:MAG: TRAP transporter substrate-binding protein [Peptococcaceae bacterium]|jgi:tripartite ATP-independent transporter DctP family solute receptor|nr:TRAP transporter substrate-binding protein [Peptococcaceae bacterium]MDH7526308.1 TRAP transporter substrate-binding protein [Peptococcaceae bacterium]
MKKRRITLPAIFLVLLLILGSMAGCAPKPAEKAKESAKPLILKLANVSPVGDPRDEAAKKFAAAVEKKTEGKVKVEVYSGGTLGTWRDTIEGLKPGIVQVVLESVGTLEPYTSLAAIDAVPFLYQGDSHFKKVWYGDLGKQLLDEVGTKGSFELMGPMHRGARYVTSKRKIETAADLKGLKIRVPEIKIYLKTWEKLGATPTPMAFTEVYTGLQQGTVEAQENPLTLSYSSAFYEVCPYLIKTKHVYSLA